MHRVRVSAIGISLAFVFAAWGPSDANATQTTGASGATASPVGGAQASSSGSLVTSGEGAYWKTDGVVSEVTSGGADVTVSDTAAQTWEGFGGTFSEMGWDYLSKLSESDRQKALELLFGKDGARFVFGRIPMGASDFAMDRYTYDETANDISLSKFSIERDRQKLIPFIKAAQALKSDIHFWASPWTPPTWMKDGPYKTPANVPSPFDGGTMKSDEAILKAYAQYFVRVIEEYGKEGIRIEMVAPQNEPNYDQNYPSCLWNPATFTTFIGKHLGPALEGKGVKIMLGTLSNADVDPERKDIDVLTSVMTDATARSYIKLIGMQYDMLKHAPVAKMIQSLTASDISLWQSEHKCGNYPWIPETYQPTPPNDHAYAVESWGLIRDWVRAGATSYSAWNMVLDTMGKGIDTTRDWAQDALLTVDTGTNSLNITPAYYVFRHISQFVDPGAKVLETSGSADALAFRNSDSTVVVLYNKDAGARRMIVAIRGKKLQVEVPADGWATINWKH